MLVFLYEIILNKISIMHLKNKPQGYVSAFASHGDPAYSNPPIKMSQVKQQETLLGANLKSFIKERLFGNFINYTKLYNARKYNFTPPVSTLTDLNDINIDGDLMKSAPAIRENYKHRVNQLRTTIEKKIHERYGNGGDKSAQKGLKNRLSHRNSIGSNIQESTLLNSQRSRINRTNLASKNSLHGSRLDRNHSYDFEKYPANSFISAIDDQLQQSSKVQNSGRKQIRLSPLNNKKQLIDKLQKVKNNLSSSNPQVKKSPARVQVQKFDIIEGTWDIFCQPIKQRNEKLPILSNNTYVSKEYQNINESFISSIQKSIDNRTFQLKNNISLQKSKFSLGKSYFIKQSFVDYFNNTNQTYPPLANHFLSFFQINVKLYDELKLEQYKKVVENIVSSSARVWAVSSFRFWDVNQDGVVCSKDIFTMYQLLDKEEVRLKENFKGQNHKGLKIVLQLKSILEDLRQIVLQVNFDAQVQKRNKSERQDEDKYEIKYLQQALIRKKQLKYSDLILILGQNIKRSTKDAKKSVIDSAKELSIKFSSCYRYSFLATDHNEQTRQDRQHIENLKQQLRKEKMEIIQKSSIGQTLQKGKILGINYKTYYQRQVSMKIKAIILQLFAIRLQ